MVKGTAGSLELLVPGEPEEQTVWLSLPASVLPLSKPIDFVIIISYNQFNEE